MRFKIFTMAAVLALGALTGCGKPAVAQMASSYNLSPDSNKKFLADNAHRKGVVVLPSGLQYRVIKSGTGLSPRSPMDTVVVVYKGWTIDGHVFDQTKPGQPAHFPAGGLIRGWVEALKHMKEGDEWELVIPASLAYGETGAGGVIGPNQTLVFDMGLIEVDPAHP
ncbi:MAG TPA: FKBP-type peptidyl-prolyl cis-trans isomerase [Rhizomicrobium sp.]|jgi:FKBP-type peptidyl-prolyl cis-trans isomerase FklB|nr:FKBP-type peptidyl-prolyl cis-trans isomerase [Rhizomicrobium sp.]